MLLAIHVIVAIAGIILSSMAAIHPSKQRIRGSIALIGTTLLTGSVLVISMRSPLMQACVSGLFYLGYTSLAVGYGRSRLPNI